MTANTPRDSRFLILTGEIELFCDPVQEWFPALTQRISETTIQGQEWTSNGEFFSKIDGLQHIQACLQEDSPLDCIDGQAASMGLDFDYIYVSQAPTRTFCRPTGVERRGTAVVRQLEASDGIADVYSTEEVRIFAGERP